MNEHLEPVFNVILIELEKADIDYWVYGGIGVAACVGRFIRSNDDVDIFIKENDFEKAKLVLRKLSVTQKDFCLKECGSLKRDGFDRPKFEIRSHKVEILSVVPIFLAQDSVTLVFGNGARNFPNKILERVERNLLGYKFFTMTNSFIKELFLNCLHHRNNWRTRDDLKKDARAILTKEEIFRAYR